MKFSEMPYKRVDMEDVEKKFRDIMERAKKASSGEELFEIHREYYRLNGYVETNATLANIRHAMWTPQMNFMRRSRHFTMKQCPSFKIIGMNI